MEWALTNYAERSRYRPMAIVLPIASYVALSGVFVGLPAWLCFLVALSLRVALTVMTYYRLRNGAVSGAWVWLMIIQFGIGPTWHLSNSLSVNLGGTLIGCVPVVLGWFAPANAGEYKDAESV